MRDTFFSNFLLLAYILAKKTIYVVAILNFCPWMLVVHYLFYFKGYGRQNCPLCNKIDAFLRLPLASFYVNGKVPRLRSSSPYFFQNYNTFKKSFVQKQHFFPFKQGHF